MNTLNRFCRLLLTIFLLAGPLQLTQAEMLRFVTSESDPPLSSEISGEAAGILPDLMRLVLKFLPEYDLKISAYPWARAQLLVQNGDAEGFLTYPSDARKQYANFSAKPIFIQDFGYLIYHRQNPNRIKLESAKSFEDLADLVFISENGSGWEEDNIPAFIKRNVAINMDSKIHLLLLRRDGDFIVLPPEMAKYLAKKFGYQNELSYSPVKFIPDSLIPFHIGIAKSHPKSQEIINLVNQIIDDPEFQKQRFDTIDRYQ